jgi:GNAT superfamily N-acetyltransferase
MALFYRSAIRNLPEGYSFRGATLQDVPMVVQLFHLRQTGGSAGPQVEEVRQEWQTLKFNPAMDVRLILDQREHLIGYIEVWSMLAQPWLWGCVHPEYEGHGIGTALLSWAEARVRLALDVLPAGQRFAPRFGAPHALTSAQALCAALGWQYTGMVSSPAKLLKKTTGALRLLEHSAYDVFEKEM